MQPRCLKEINPSFTSVRFAAHEKSSVLRGCQSLKDFSCFMLTKINRLKF